jgi:hypothetical protein
MDGLRPDPLVAVRSVSRSRGGSCRLAGERARRLWARSQHGSRLEPGVARIVGWSEAPMGAARGRQMPSRCEGRLDQPKRRASEDARTWRTGEDAAPGARGWRGVLRLDDCHDPRGSPRGRAARVGVGRAVARWPEQRPRPRRSQIAFLFRASRCPMRKASFARRRVVIGLRSSSSVGTRGEKTWCATGQVDGLRSCV